ncbi:MAG: radical SAM protein [Planctomycetota bacterium]
MKTCTQNCIYCQLGKDAPQTLQRKDYVSIEAVLNELEQKITEGLEADFITISGSGEPTLHLHLGELIDGIRQLTDIPIAIITNSTLLYDPGVRQDCCLLMGLFGSGANTAADSGWRCFSVKASIPMRPLYEISQS